MTQWVTAHLVIDWFYMKITFEEDTRFTAETVAQAVVLKAVELTLV